MKAIFSVVIALSIASRVAVADPETGTAPSPQKVEAAPLGLPEKDGATTAAPALLPRLNLLAPPPERTRPDRHHGTKPMIAGEVQDTSEEILRPIRAGAMRSPMAVKILLDTESASTPELRRYLLRQYVLTICKRMRSQKPALAQVITAFENAQIQMIYRSKAPHLTSNGTIEDKS